MPTLFLNSLQKYAVSPKPESSAPFAIGKSPDSKSAFAYRTEKVKCTEKSLTINPVQFNVFSADTLISAQKEPEKYRDLQIRVCGWNVYFVNLEKQMQGCVYKRSPS